MVVLLRIVGWVFWCDLQSPRSAGTGEQIVPSLGQYEAYAVAFIVADCVLGRRCRRRRYRLACAQARE
jgi:hypothetical protein